MFGKLRLQLTLTNVAVVSLIFLIFVSGIFLVMIKITNDQTDQLFNLIATNEGLTKSVSKQTDHDQDEHQYRYFYIKTNFQGTITSTSTGLDLTNPHIKSLIDRVIKSESNKEKIEIEDVEYNFEKIRYNSNEMAIIFVNTNSENTMLDELLVALIITGVVGLVLVFFGSRFMAERSLIPIKASWKMQKDFVADASHELRTPLSVIETTLELIMNKKDQTVESQVKWLENIHAENKRMTRLVNDLLFLARADSEQLMLEMKPFPLHSSLLEAYIPFEAVALQKGIHLKAFEGLQMEFFGDETRIKQLAIILVDNAIKHTSEGGSVGMSLSDNNTSVEIIVSDTGEGIEKEHLDKIFQRFYRVDKSRSRKEGSVGLGLSIAEWIAKGHHGVIKVESIRGVGTTFRVILPKRH